MYDFYANPPTSIDDIEEYLTSWLIPVVEKTEPVVYGGHTWIQTHGFRRACTIHAVFKNDGGSYGFHVDSDDKEGWRGDGQPNMGTYDSWDMMIHGVAKIYAKLWKIE